MEFNLNSKYIEIKISNFSNEKNNNKNLKEIIYNNENEEKNKKNLEIFVNLDDYYLINNINILIKLLFLYFKYN